MLDTGLIPRASRLVIRYVPLHSWSLQAQAQAQAPVPPLVNPVLVYLLKGPTLAVRPHLSEKPVQRHRHLRELGGHPLRISVMVAMCVT